MDASVKPHQEFSGIYWVRLKDGSRRLATKNLAPGKNVYGEQLISFKGLEYRIWDPFRSKLAAAILKGLTSVPIQPRHRVLYLGSASGTTASHVSDIVGDRGHVYCVEFAPRSMREFIDNVCLYRPNLTPILEDARLPRKYAMFVERVDDIYCDVAQPEQAKILADNAELFLKKKGWTMLTVKSRSIDVTRKPTEIYDQEGEVLRDRGFVIQEIVQLDPYDKDHALIVSKI